MMNRIIAVLLTPMAALVLSGCAQNHAIENAKKPEQEKVIGMKERNRGTFPDTLSISPDSLHAAAEREKLILKAERKHIEGALEAVIETQNAAAVLKSSKKDSALVALEHVVGKLDLLLARYPETDLIPIDFSVEVVNLVQNLGQVQETRKAVEDLVDEGFLQDARRMLDELVSEIRFTTAYIPMETYPGAIKEAASLLEQGKEQEARTTLEDALASLIIVEQSVPLPVISAEVMIEEAAKVAESDKEKAQEHLRDAQEQLHLARELGYGQRNKEYNSLDTAIKSISAGIKKGERTGGLLDSLKTRLREFKNRISK